MNDLVNSGSGDCGSGCGCGACQGIHTATPVTAVNRPGLSAIRFRVGDHPRFKDSLLAGLSTTANPALAELSTRSDDDFTVALFDAFSTMADVLTFYQERIANESYLGTAVERRSVAQIARLVGYELAPGVAAHTQLAFTLQDGPGSVVSLPLGAGIKVQSTPGPNEKPQMFETVEAIEARTAWSRILVQSTEPQDLSQRPSRLRLAGAALNLRQGDGVLTVYEGPGAHETTASYRVIRDLKQDSKGQWTEVAMGEERARGHFGGVAAKERGVFVFRTQASLFGHNAAQHRVSPKGDVSPWTLVAGLNSVRQLTLDAVYRSVVPGSWAIWTSPMADPDTHILRVDAVGQRGIALYGMSGKATRVLFTRGKGVLRKLRPASFSELRSIAVAAQSEQIDLSDPPLRIPIRGKTLSLAGPVEGLSPGQKIALTGNPLQAEVRHPVKVLLRSKTGRTQRILHPPQLLDVVAFPVPLSDGQVRYRIRLDGHFGLIVCRPEKLRYLTENVRSEAGVIDEIAADRRSIVLVSPLQRAYEPSSVVLNANVAEATHGESVKELLGSGDSSQRFQKFTLKQPPLTFVAATTSSGTRSTLQVWVNDLQWHEVPALYGRGPRDHVFVTRTDLDGNVSVQFGDGKTGSRVPSGMQNVWATYRKGIGREGNLKAGQINLLMSRPLGLKDAQNPIPSADAENPDHPRKARQDAPATVLTLDRVVSLQDYEDFSRTFAGIAKAKATWTWFGQKRGVFVTVAGPQGAELSRKARRLLHSALREYGDRFVDIQVENYRPVEFRMGLRVKPAPGRERAHVFEAVKTALHQQYSFGHRDFGQAVTFGELSAFAQEVPGVLAVQIVRLYRAHHPADPKAGLRAPLLARSPHRGHRGVNHGAELLTLRPGPLDLLEILP